MAQSIQYPALVEPLAPYVEGAPALSWQQPQQPPVKHRPFRPASSSVAGVEPTLLELPTYAWWFQPQQEPVPHNFYRPISVSIAGIDPSLLEETTQLLWFQPQQPPVPHEWYRPASYAVGWQESSLIDADSQQHWFQPQQPPVPHKWYRPASYAVGWQETSLLDASSILHWFQPQQSPVPHRWYRPASFSVGEQAPANLEDVTQLYWFQPQAEPQPLRRRKVWLDQFVRAPDESEFFVFDVSTFPFPPQERPLPLRRKSVRPDPFVRGPDESEFATFDVTTMPQVTQQAPVAHRFYRSASVEVEGQAPAILEPVTQVQWLQPQYPPTPHRTFKDVSVFIYAPTFVDPVYRKYPFVPRDPKLPLPLRKFVDVVAQIVNSFIRQGVLEMSGQSSWRLARAGGIVATRAPTTTDDAAHGYFLGQVWVDGNAGTAYIAVDMTNGAAVWQQIN